MLGTIVNTCCILLGSAIGSIAKKGLKPKYQEAIFTALGIATVGMGLNAVTQNMPHSSYPVLFIVSMAIGAVVGTALDLEARFKKAVSKHSKDGSEFAKGLSTAIMLFCVGTLSILGPINSALYGDETYLLTNATLDLVSSMVFGATFGFGIAIAAVVLFLLAGRYLFTRWHTCPTYGRWNDDRNRYHWRLAHSCKRHKPLEAQRDFHHESASRPLYSAHLVCSAFSNGKSLGDNLMFSGPHINGTRQEEVAIDLIKAISR